MPSEWIPTVLYILIGLTAVGAIVSWWLVRSLSHYANLEARFFNVEKNLSEIQQQKEYVEKNLSDIQQQKEYVEKNLSDIQQQKEHVERHLAENIRKTNAYRDGLEQLHETITEQHFWLKHIIHDWPKQLNTITDASSAIMRKRPNANIHYKYLEQTIESLQRQVKQVSAIIHQSDPNASFRMKQVDVDYMLQDIIERKNRAIKTRDVSSELISIQYSSKNALPSILADADALMSAVENLIENAIKFAESHIVVTSWVTDSTLRISVADDGPGVNEKEIERIYHNNPIASGAMHKGMGYGLLIVKLVARKHKGKLVISRSSLGGAEFTIQIPVSA